MQLFSKDLKTTKQLLSSSGTVCLVGGGGKTTLMYTLARRRAGLGEKMLVSTTTHIYMPPRFYAVDEAQAQALWVQNLPAVIGVPEGEKLTAASPALLKTLQAQADVTFLESDGAKGHPCKVPAEHEPVISPECSLVLAVFGLSAIGRPLGEVCFRAERAMELLGMNIDHIITPQDAARMLVSPLGGKKGIGARRWCAVLNQCDNPLRRKYADEVATYLKNMGEENVMMTAFDEEERAAWSKI